MSDYAEREKYNRLGIIIAAGWTDSSSGPYIEEEKAYATLLHAGYLRPRVRETLKEAGVLGQDPATGDYFINKEKLLAIVLHLKASLKDAPGRIPLRRPIGMVPSANG